MTELTTTFPLSRASFSLGRPFALDASEITVEKPNAFTAETDDPRWRTYYPASAGPTCEVSDAGPPRDLVLSISERRINLYDTVGPIARALFVSQYVRIHIYAG